MIAESSLIRQLHTAVWASGVQKLAAFFAEVGAVSILRLATWANDHGILFMRLFCLRLNFHNYTDALEF